jgi:Protein of unknown function (DUF2442)
MEKVTAVQALEDYRLKVVFNTGDIKLFDCKPYLDRGVFSKLKDPGLFRQAYVAYDTVCWPGNLDIAPETLFDRGVA